jgi:hypothetical protein
MRRRVIGTVVGAALVVAAPGVGVANAPAGIGHASDPVAQMTCTGAKIGGKRKCIARGQYCARRYERQYVRYGFTCSKRDRRGRWHLQ